jgi:hypothetical protein
MPTYRNDEEIGTDGLINVTPEGPSAVEILQNTTNNKLQRLSQAKDNKLRSLTNSGTYNSPILGQTSGKDWYDADSPYNNNIVPSNTNNTMRLGDIDSSTELYVNTPEKRFKGREATPEERAAYSASMLAKDNFAMGTTPASKESFQDLIDNPLTPENQALYDAAMAEIYKEGMGKFDLRGIEGKVGKYGRQVVQAYNPTAPNPQESLQDRLLATGNAEMYRKGKPVQEQNGQITSASTYEERLASLQKKFNENMDYGVMHEVGQTLAGAAAGVMKGGVELVDVAQELVTWAPQELYNKITGENKDIDLIDDDFKKVVREGIDEAVGYNAALDQQTLQEVTELIEETGINIADSSTYKNVTEAKHLKTLAKVVGKLAMNPSLTAGMITETVGAGGVLGVGTKVTAKIGAKVLPELTAKVGKVFESNASRISKELKAVRADATLDAAAKVKAIENLENSYSLGKKVVDVVKGTTMSNADMAVRMNQWIDEYKANNKDENGNEQDPSFGKLLEMGLMARVTSSAEVGSLKLSFGIKDGIKQLTENSKKGIRAAFMKAAKAYGTNIPVEMLQETVDGIVETIATQKDASKYEGKTVQELLEAKSSEILTGTFAGGAGGFHASSVGSVPKAVSSSVNVMTAAKEKLDNYMETAESENKGKATTQAGRKNKFDTVVGEGGRDLDIEESVKGDWVDDLSKYASEVWLSEDLKKGTEYEKTPTKIIDDTVDAIAKIKNVKSEEGKDLIRTGLFKRFFDESNAIDEKTGEAKPLTQDQKTGMLKVFLDKFKGNKQVENEAERQYEEVLKAKFAEIQNRLKSEGVNVDADFSSKGALTQGELDSLESILSDMKVMGSESLTELAEKVSQVMTKRQELLGSEDGENGPTKKDFKEVRKEIEELGFLLKGPNYKSIKQHKRDLEDYLTVEGADSVKGDEAMADIARFVKSRDGKIQMFDKSGDLEKLRSVGAIKFFAQTTLEDTRNMSAMLKEMFPKLKDEGVKQEFMGMIAALDGVEADLRDVVNEKDGAKLYTKLAEKVSLTKPEKALLDKTLQEYNDGVKEPETESPDESDAPVTPKIEANMKAFIDKEISNGESKENLLARMDTNGKISREMRAVIAEYIRGLEDVKVDDTVDTEIKDEKKEESTTSTETKEEPVVEEKPTAYTKEDVQFMQGMLDESEQELEEMKAELEKVTNINVETGGEIRSKRKEVGTTKAEKNDAKERIDELYEDIQAHNKLIDELLKNKKSKIAQKRALVAEIKAHKEKLEALGKKLEKLSANTEMKESQKMNAAGKLRKVLTDLVDRFRMVLNKIEQRIIKMSEMKAIKQLEANELQKEIQDLATQVDEVKASKERTREAIKEVMPEYRNLITDYKRALNDLEEAKAVRDDLLAVEGFDTEGLADYKAKYKDLKVLIKGLKKDIATAFRLDVQEVVGDVAASNESNRRSLTNRLHFGEDIMEIMPKIIKASEKGKEKVANALATFATFERNRGALVNQDEGFANNPEKEVLKRLGLDKLFSDKTIQEKVKKAVNVTSLLTMNDMIGMRSMPGDMLKSAVEGAFGNVWSYADSGKRDGEIDWLVNQVRQGKIVPVATFADAAGRRLLEELEIKLDTENMQDRADATKLLGELVINNILPKSNKGTDPRKGIVARDEANGPLQIKVVSNGKGKQLPSIRVLDISTVPNDFRQDIQEAGNVFEYASETTDGMIGFSPITHESGKRGRNSDVIITDAEIAYLNEQGSKEWKFDPSFKNLWEEQAGKDLKKLKEMFLGTKEELAAKEHVMDVESAIAKYTAQELDLERMVMAYELAGDKPFYIGWDYTVSNRNMMNNKMLNPQNSKFSRFIVSMKDMVNDVKVGDYTDVMLAISQAFDMDPDKQTDENAIKELRTGTDIKVDMEVKDGELVINELSENVQSIIDDDSVSVERIRKELAPGSDHLMHVYQALDLLQKVQRGEKLRTNLALEGDGITNGMATTTTQIGMNKDTKAYYEKMGMYRSGSSVNNHGEFKERGGKDIYQTPEDAIIEELNDLSKVGEVVDGESELAKAVKNLVPKDGAGKAKWRGFLKPLVMVFIYGAGIQNISMNGSRGLAVSMVKDKDMQTGKDLLKAMEVFMEQESLAETIVAEGERSKTREALNRVQAKLPEIGKVRYDLDTGRMVPDVDGQMYVDQSMLNDMATVINASVGKALDGAFSKSFGPITKYRQVLKTVNEMNYLAFTVAFNKKLKDKFGATRLAELSKEQLVEIKDEMVEEGTYYGSTNMHGGTQDYFKTQQDTEFDGDTIEVRLSSTFGTFQSYKGSAQTINQTIKTIASNVGAVGVIDVHSVDGGTMIKGHIKDVLNIFDALVLGTNGALNNEQMKEINAAYYKINMEHSILGKAVEKLVKNSESLLAFDPEADAQIAKDVVADMKRIMGTGFDPKDMGNVVEGLMESVEEIHNSRHTLWNTDMNVKQYYVADRHEAAKWDEKARNEAKTDRIGVFANDESKAADEKQMLGNMFAVLGDIVKSSETVTAKAKTKSNIDIITQIDDVLNSIKEPEVKEKMKTWFKEELKKHGNPEEGCV